MMKLLRLAIVRRSSMVFSFSKFNLNATHPRNLFGCLCALLVANVAVADENWDRVCDELESAYKRGLSAVVEKGKAYDMTRTSGYASQVSDVWGWTIISTVKAGLMPRMGC